MIVEKWSHYSLSRVARGSASGLMEQLPECLKGFWAREARAKEVHLEKKTSVMPLKCSINILQ